MKSLILVPPFAYYLNSKKKDLFSDLNGLTPIQYSNSLKGVGMLSGKRVPQSIFLSFKGFKTPLYNYIRHFQLKLIQEGLYGGRLHLESTLSSRDLKHTFPAYQG